METAPELIEHFNAAMDTFRDTLDAFNPDDINTHPPGNGWSAAQVADHILKSIEKFPQLFNGPVKNANRDPEMQKKPLAGIFLDFSKKLQAPDFIIPRNEPLEKDELLQTLLNKQQQINAAMESVELDNIFSNASLPVFGELTGREWTWFAVFHIQ